MSATSDDPNPYPGPRPFNREEERLFFGRAAESRDLFSLITAHRVLLVFAQSGAGKTSLIQAGLIPILEKEGFEVLPSARVGGLIPEGIGASGVSNIYVFAVLTSWDADKSPRRLLHQSLNDSLARRPRQVDQRGDPWPRVAIFDQFEEIFSAHPERWEDRKGFFQQVSEALEADGLLRVVLVIREDYIAQLDPHAEQLPGKLRARFRLERLGREAALQAVTRPLSGTGVSFAKGVAERLVEELQKEKIARPDGQTVEIAGEFVEPVQLQVVCRRLWGPEIKRITYRRLQSVGNIDTALSQLYDDAVRTAAAKAHCDERRLRDWCENNLITDLGTRGTAYRDRRATKGIPNTALEELERQHLIRAEFRAGAVWYELTHDRFIDPIRASNKNWGIMRGTQLRMFSLLRTPGDDMPMMTLRELLARERPKAEGGDLLIQPGKVAVIVSSAQPIELNYEGARVVMANMKAKAQYEYFFEGQDRNLAPMAELIQKLVLANMVSKERLPADPRRFMAARAEQIRKNLRLMKWHLSIHFQRRPPQEFCIHNAYSETDAVCYMRGEKAHFIRWLEQKDAADVASKLRSSCITEHKEDSIFHSTDQFDLKNEHGSLGDRLCQLIQERFPTNLTTTVEAICFGRNFKSSGS